MAPVPNDITNAYSQKWSDLAVESAQESVQIEPTIEVENPEVTPATPFVDQQVLQIAVRLADLIDESTGDVTRITAKGDEAEIVKAELLTGPNSEPLPVTTERVASMVGQLEVRSLVRRADTLARTTLDQLQKRNTEELSGLKDEDANLAQIEQTFSQNPNLQRQERILQTTQAEFESTQQIVSTSRAQAIEARKQFKQKSEAYFASLQSKRKVATPNAYATDPGSALLSRIMAIDNLSTGEQVALGVAVAKSSFMRIGAQESAKNQSTPRDLQLFAMKLPEIQQRDSQYLESFLPNRALAGQIDVHVVNALRSPLEYLPENLNLQEVETNPVNSYTLFQILEQIVKVDNEVPTHLKGYLDRIRRIASSISTDIVGDGKRAISENVIPNVRDFNHYILTLIAQQSVFLAVSNQDTDGRLALISTSLNELVGNKQITEISETTSETPVMSYKEKVRFILSKRAFMDEYRSTIAQETKLETAEAALALHQGAISRIEEAIEEIHNNTYVGRYNLPSLKQRQQEVSLRRSALLQDGIFLISTEAMNLYRASTLAYLINPTGLDNPEIQARNIDDIYDELNEYGHNVFSPALYKRILALESCRGLRDRVGQQSMEVALALEVSDLLPYANTLNVLRGLMSIKPEQADYRDFAYSIATIRGLFKQYVYDMRTSETMSREIVAETLSRIPNQYQRLLPPTDQLFELLEYGRQLKTKALQNPGSLENPSYDLASAVPVLLGDQLYDLNSFAKHKIDYFRGLYKATSDNGKTLFRYLLSNLTYLSVKEILELVKGEAESLPQA